MKVQVTSQNQAGHTPTTLACPHCRTQAVLENFPAFQDIRVNPAQQIVTGQGKCPNPECNGHVFIVRRLNQLATMYPPTRINFNASDIPGPIVTTFEEAITGETNECYVAAAIMVRRTLEEICAGQKAEGDNLKARIT